MAWLIGIILAPFVLFGLLIAWVIIDETEYPYLLTIRRIRRARTLDGRPALNVIAQTWNVSPAQLHVHTCGYCKSRWTLGRDLTYAWIAIGNDARKSLHFVYRRSTNELAPADPDSVEKFHDMIPTGVEMVCSDRNATQDSRLLPRHWREITPVRD